MVNLEEPTVQDFIKEMLFRDKRISYLERINLKHGGNNIQPDICFSLKNGKIICIEVKGSVNYDELRKGVGQAISYMPFCNESYLGVPKEIEEVSKDLLKNLPIGLIVVSQSKCEIIKESSVKKIEDEQLKYILSSYRTSSDWASLQRLNYLSDLFEKYKEFSGRTKRYGKYGFIFVIKSIVDLTKNKLGTKKYEKIKEITQEKSLYKKQLNKIDKICNNAWFAENEILKKSDIISKKYNTKHTELSFYWRLSEFVLLGILELKTENEKRYYRLNPAFIPFIENKTDSFLKEIIN